MQTTGDTGSVPIDLQLYGQDYGESNDYVIDDVTWPWKVDVVFGPIISKTVGDTDCRV